MSHRLIVDAVLYLAVATIALAHTQLQYIESDNGLTITDNSPWTQVAILGFVTFCSVGMFSAIGGLGAG